MLKEKFAAAKAAAAKVAKAGSVAASLWSPSRALKTRLLCQTKFGTISFWVWENPRTQKLQTAIRLQSKKAVSEADRLLVGRLLTSCRFPSEAAAIEGFKEALELGASTVLWTVLLDGKYAVKYPNK